MGSIPLLCRCPRDLARAGIHQMRGLARGTGDRLVALIILVNLVGRPALHVLACVRKTKAPIIRTLATIDRIDLMSIKTVANPAILNSEQPRGSNSPVLPPLIIPRAMIKRRPAL